MGHAHSATLPVKNDIYTVYPYIAYGVYVCNTHCMCNCFTGIRFGTHQYYPTQGRTFRRVTLQSAVSDLQLFLNNQSEQNRSERHFVSPSVFRDRLPDFNHISALVNGPAHLIAHFVDDLLSCVCNETSQFAWTADVRAVEHDLGRFRQ